MTARGVHPENRWYQASNRASVRPSLGLRFPSQKRIVGCVSKVDRPRPCKQRPLAGSIPVTSTGVCIALWEADAHQGNIIITCSASGSTMGCSRPLIFPGESRDKLPRQGGRRRLCNLRLVASAFSLLLYTKPRGTNFRTSEFHRSSSPSGPLRAEPLESATPHSQWRE